MERPSGMDPATLDALAARAGTSAAYVQRLLDASVLGPDCTDTDADAARVKIVQALERGGIPIETLGQAIREGYLSLDFVDAPSYRVFSSYGSETFADVARRTELPVDVLLSIREAMGFAVPDADDRMRVDELQVVPYLVVQRSVGVRPTSMERWLRVYGESLRRIAETESDLWRTDILEPLFRSGMSMVDVGRRTGAIADAIEAPSADALMSIMHGQQSIAWVRNILEGFETTLERVGMHRATERVPAICFLDITGYTHMTEERGDEAAADLAGKLGRMVQRVSAEHGGKAVKWLGDGVMFHFAEPASGVVAALDMVADVASADLPPAHVGLHSGPVLFQEGDYFGRTVNVAARIADYARQGEVLVSDEVVRMSDVPRVAFTSIGPVELKGVAGTTLLYRAERA